MAGLYFCDSRYVSEKLDAILILIFMAAFSQDPGRLGGPRMPDSRGAFCRAFSEPRQCE
jgi:hypothetical protein